MDCRDKLSRPVGLILPTSPSFLKKQQIPVHPPLGKSTAVQQTVPRISISNAMLDQLLNDDQLVLQNSAPLSMLSNLGLPYSSSSIHPARRAQR